MTTKQQSTNDASGIHDPRYAAALATVERTLERFRGSSQEEKEKVHREIAQLKAMVTKLTSGRVEIVVFGEISTGKSALINALVGDCVADVDVRGGWTKETWHVAWEGCGYVMEGLADSRVVLVDTPGLNEVGGADRTKIAREAADQADLILFVTDSDLNETEFSALLALATAHKPILLVLNKVDLYTPQQRQRLTEVLREDRVLDILPEENVVLAAADPREVEYIIESTDGKTTSQWRRPPPAVADVKTRILEILEKDGLALLCKFSKPTPAFRSGRVQKGSTLSASSGLLSRPAPMFPALLSAPSLMAANGRTIR